MLRIPTIIVVLALTSLPGSESGLAEPELRTSPQVVTVVDSIEALVRRTEELLGPAGHPPPGRGADEGAVSLPASPGDDAQAARPELLRFALGGLEPVEPLPACGGGVLASFGVDAIQPPGPGSGAYQPPDRETLAGIAASLGVMLEGRASLAAEYASVAGYELCAGESHEAGLVLWRASLPGSGHALIAWRPGAARPLIVEAPHPFYDEGTLEQAVKIFVALDARALLVAGTHRCASLAPSGCDGFTAACEGTPTRYRESDMAHNNHSVFQLAHEILAANFADDIVLSLHGMVGTGGIISDGTLIPTSSTALVARFTRELAALVADQPIISCNAWPGVDSAENLCGTTNTQGRYLNGIIEDHCLQAAIYSSGRFLHLEQGRDLRARGVELITALDRTLPRVSR